MKLLEYQSKRIVARYDIPIPQGEVAATPDDVRRIAGRLGRRVVIKAQVLSAGRGKAGGIRLAHTDGEAADVARHILGMEIEGQRVNKVLVDEAVDIARELYLGITLDQRARRLVLMASAERSPNIPEMAYLSPEKVFRATIEPGLGLQPFQCRELAFSMGLERGIVDEFVRVCLGLYRALTDWDALLIELNPLVLTDQGRLLAVDGRIVLDDNALYRHSDLIELRELEADPLEIEAQRFDMDYVRLDGDIGCISNGAGLAMCTMDAIRLCGGEPANFLDIGEDVTTDRVVAALRLVLSDVRVKAVLVNVFDAMALGFGRRPPHLPGDVIQKDELAFGRSASVHWDALASARPQRPVVVCRRGDASGPTKLPRSVPNGANLLTADSLLSAARLAVGAARLADEALDV